MLDSDLTQESLGKKLGVKQGMISNWLRGYRKSLSCVAEKNCHTNKPLNYFLDDSENVQNVGNHSIVVGHNTNEKVVVNEKSVEMLGLKLDLILEKLNNIKNNIDRSINMIAGLVLLVLLVLLILLIFGFDKGRRIIIWLISGTICLIILIIIVVIVGLICLKK